MHRFAFSLDGSVRATRKLQLVHSDVCGPMRTPSVGNSLYFVTFIDDFSRFCWVYPLKAKSDVSAIFQHYVSMVENETGCKVQTLRTDRGGEYMSGAFKDFLGKKGIKHQCTMPYTPQQNGVVVRKNRSLMEMARCMLKAKGLPHKLWMETVACAAHVLNRCPTHALKNITPYESWYDRKPYVRHMQTQDVFEGFLPSFVENQESQQVDNFDQSFDQHVTPDDVEEIVREEQEVLREERTLPKMPRQKTAKQWDRTPYEADDLSTNYKSHILDEVLAHIPAHIFIAKFKDEEGDNIKTTIMPREIWTLHRRPKVASAVRAVHLEQFFRLPPWGTDYMRAHKLMSSIQYDGKAMLTDSDGAKVEVLITKDIINEALQFIPGAYDLIPKTKAIDNEKAFLKVKGSKFKYSDLIYSELELPLRLISQRLRVQKPPRYIEPFLHMAVVMAFCVAEKRQVHCDFAKYILESLIEANLKNSAKNKLYMNAGPMLTRIAYQALSMIEDLPAASSQASLIQQAKYIPKAVRTTSSAASSRSTRSKKSLSKKERTETDKEQDSQEFAREDVSKEAETTVPFEYESDEEDTSIPLERKSQQARKLFKR
ncbi:hypothetical protein L7F22_026614 [Adiantum nelumboides]|nr:hypothetical protein [Adiantum nelumboides]